MDLYTLFERILFIHLGKTHIKKVFFSGRTTKVPPPPWPSGRVLLIKGVN